MARRKKTTRSAPPRRKTQATKGMGHPIGGLIGLVLKIFPIVLVLGLLGGSFFGVKEVLYADPTLKVQEIRISPMGAFSHEKLVALEKKIMGNNILDVDLKSIAGELEKNPQIKRAAVIRQMPATIKIDVQIRNPIAFIQFSPEKRHALISEDGMILDYVDHADSSFVVIRSYEMGLKEPAAGYQIKNRGFSEAIKFLKAYWESSMSEKQDLTALEIDSAGAVSMRLHDQLQIRLGRQPSMRLETMQKIIHLLESDTRDKIEYIDLQFDNVIVKKK